MSGGGYSVITQTKQTPTSAGAVTETPPDGAVGFYVSVQTQDARISFDGTAATATNGIYFKAGQNTPEFFPIIPASLSIIGLNAAASDITFIWVK